MKAISYLLTVATTLLCACSAPSQLHQSQGDKLAGAVVSPLTSLNLVREDIPQELHFAKNKGLSNINSETKKQIDCKAIKEELNSLHDLLGIMPGEPVAVEPDNDSLLDKGKEAAEKAVISTVRSTTQSVIPFSGLVSKISGASRHEAKVRDAIDAGRLRTAYLVGLSQGMKCK